MLIIPRPTNEQYNKMQKENLKFYRNLEMKKLHQLLEKRRNSVSQILNSKDINQILSLAEQIKFKDRQIENLQRYIYNL